MPAGLVWLGVIAAAVFWANCMQRHFDSFHRFQSKRQRERENVYFKYVIEFNAFTYFETNTYTHRASFYRNFEPNKCRCCKSFITFYHLILAHECFSNAIITLDFFLRFFAFDLYPYGGKISNVHVIRCLPFYEFREMKSMLFIGTR